MSLHSGTARISRWCAARMMHRPMLLDRPQGVVSFTFDDAPQSACQRGAAALERHGCKGTWYIAGGLTQQQEMGRDCHTKSDLQQLLANGHHIGCHTFSHRPLSQLSRSGIGTEFARNGEFLRALGLDPTQLDFAYPLGNFGLTSKRLATQHYRSVRITGGGLQVGAADLNALCSERLYQGAITDKQIHDLSMATARNRGWLIFYTHDVEANPSPYGCKPELLELAVDAALEAGCRVLPVNEAIDYWVRGVTAQSAHAPLAS